MLGALGDAEDIVQEAFLRWHAADVATIRSAEAWLVATTTRLAIDRLRTAAAERRAYVGPWLPEPWPGDVDDVAPDRRLERATDLWVAFLLLLERLTPEERAAFLLLQAGFTDGRAAAAEGAVVTPAFAYDLPNLPGQRVTGILVAYGPGGSSPPHHHTKEGSVVAYVLEGAIRSKVDDGPERVYRAGESWLEPPGAAHSVSANTSATEPARVLAVFVAADGAELTTFDE